MRRPVAVALALPLLAGCGVRPTGVVYAGEAPVATASPSARAQVYLLNGEMPMPVERPVNPANAQEVFDALLRGPNEEERAAGLYTELDGIKKIMAHRIDGGTLFVDTVPSLPKLSPRGYAQIYCTGLALPDRPLVRLPYLNIEASGAYVSKACPGGTRTRPADQASQPVPAPSSSIG